MFASEAAWLGFELKRLSSQAGNATVINLGSQTLEFRQETQPFISELVFEPLESLARVVHVDIQEDPGVDLQLDILAPNAVNILQKLGADIVVASNILEHVQNVEAALELLRQLGDRGCTVIVSGPRHFPYHPDPIDNMFRPSRRNLTKLMWPLEMQTYARFISPTALTASCNGTALKRRAWQWFVHGRKTTLGVRSAPKPPLNLLFPVTAFGAVFRPSQ